MEIVSNVFSSDSQRNADIEIKVFSIKIESTGFFINHILLVMLKKPEAIAMLTFSGCSDVNFLNTL